MKATIISDRAGHRPHGLHLDARHLPNPYDISRFRPRDGRDPEVRAWVTNTVEAKAMINTAERAILDGQTTITVTCSAGRHRSVAIAETIADDLRASGYDVTVEHRVLAQAAQKKARKKTITEAGLGWNHQQARARLIRRLRDGATCWWCGRPMEHVMALDADHSTSRSHGGKQADRLLHARCNRQRGAGDQDDRRPALGAVGGLTALPVRLLDGSDDPRWPGEGVSRRPVEPEPGCFTWGNVTVG